MLFPNNYCGECPMWLAIDDHNYEEILKRCQECHVLKDDREPDALKNIIPGGIRIMNNNATVEKIEIKLRGDNVYDIYVNKIHIGQAGNYLKALDILKRYFEQGA